MQKIIIEYQNALSPVLLSSIQLFTSLLSHRCSLTAVLLCAIRSALLFKKCLKVDQNSYCWQNLSRHQVSPPKILNCERKLLQMRRNCEDLASVKKPQDCCLLQLWSSLNVCEIFIAVINPAVTENV